MAVKLNYCADDLLNLKFKKNVKGYDAYHVDSTLDKVISDLRYYENFYKEAKDYIAELESKFKTLRDKNSELEVQISGMKKTIEAIKNKKGANFDNIQLYEKIDKYERYLFKMGVDPTKIK